MKCKHVEKKIIDSFEKMGRGSFNREIKEHIEQCNQCAEFAENYRRIKHNVGCLRHPAPAENLVENTLSLCHSELVSAKNLASAAQTGQTKTPLFIWFLFGALIVSTILWAVQIFSDYAQGQPVSNNVVWALIICVQNLMMLFLSPILLRPLKFDSPKLNMI